MISKTHIIGYTALLGFIYISGCCTPGIKPEDANIFQAACGISTGEFDNQVEHARQKARNSGDIAELEKTRAEQLQTELAEREKERARLEKELVLLVNSSKKIEDRIRSVRAETDEDIQRRIEKLGELATVKAEMEQLRLQQGNMSNEAIIKKIDVLKQEIEVLRRISIEQ